MHWPDDRKKIRASYDTQGFVVVKQFCQKQQVQLLRDNLDRYISDIVPDLPAMDVFYENKSVQHQIRQLPRMGLHDPWFHDQLTIGPLPQIAEHLIGCSVVPQDVSYFNKLAEIGDPTPPHQDGFYFHLDPCEALTLWVALDDVDEENGCMHYVAGSHQRGMRNHGRTQVLGFSQGVVDYGSEEDRANEVPACASAGDLVIHDAMTIHRTGANHSTRSRRALGFVYYSSRAQTDTAAKSQYHEKLSGELKAEGRI
ncbi:MAG: phytanoyl-CoA dioxygenase family protein [Fuerstiella sp.]|nr:phytanoyl-CoA dioxygenase family protein [Fuerstiella sp.]